MLFTLSLQTKILAQTEGAHTQTQPNPRAFQVVKLHKNCHVLLAMGERLLVTYDHPPWYTPSLWV